MAKPPTAAQKRYLAHIREKTCCACGRFPTEAHHLRHDGRKGISKTHKLVVPLCPICHRTGAEAIHRISHPRFETLWEINLLGEAQRLWSEYNG